MLKRLAVGNVLLVDDNEIDNSIHQKVIEMDGFALHIVARQNGKSALAYLEASKNNPSTFPDLIFLDLNMPVVNGFVFLNEFERLYSPLNTKCKIVILTSSENERDIERVYNFKSVIFYTTKPLTSEALADLRVVLNKSNL